MSSVVATAPDRRDGRIVAIDALRGLVMVIMALDHTRDFLHLGSHGLDPTDPVASNPVLFATRWITHLCAPTFVLLSGLSIWLQRKGSDNGGGKSRAELSAFLLTRGLWLILVDAVIVSFALNFNFDLVILTVIAAIGASMVLLAGLVWLPVRAVLLIGIALICGHNLFDGFDAKTLGPWADPFQALVGPIDLVQLGPVKVLVAYAILPWTGVMALGYGLGPLFDLSASKRGRILTLLGLAMITAFIAIRAIDLYGDPRPWAAQPTQARAIMAFLSVTKYPPSLDFVLATLGPILVLLPWLERLGGKLSGVLATYGRVPLFYYVGHLYGLHLIALGAGLALGRPLASLATNPGQITGFGFSLAVVYGVWVAVVLSFYPLCAWYGGFRRRHRDWRWLGYL